MMWNSNTAIVRKCYLFVDLKDTTSEPLDLVSKVSYAAASFLEQLILNGALCLFH